MTTVENFQGYHTIDVTAYFCFHINNTYRQTSNISGTLVGNKIDDHCCSKYIFILDLTPGFNVLGKCNCMVRRK